MKKDAGVAALVNGLVVLLLPLAFIVVGSLTPDSTNASTTVHAGIGPGVFISSLWTWTRLWIVLTPLALVAAWRTFAYARDRDDRPRATWLGVLEAGGWGLGLMLALMAPAIVNEPLAALPYAAGYGGIACAVGLALGLVLHTTARIALTIRRVRSPV